MKQFFGAFFGSMIGLVVATIIGVIVFVALLKSSFSSAMKDEKDDAPTEKAVLHLDLRGRILDRENTNPFSEIRKAASMGEEEGTGLNVMLAKIRQASEDDDIKGLYLTFNNLRAGLATLQELRDAVIKFKKSGKFVYAYGENISGTEYFLASAADKVFVNPQGDVEWKGLSMQLMFFKNTLEKLDIDVQVFRHGQYKSAIEPFLLEKMSQANRMQSRSYLGSMWSSITGEVAKSRKTDAASLNTLADNINAHFPEKLVPVLIDSLMYYDEVISAIKKKISVEDSVKYNFTDLDKYKLKYKTGEKKIAVIYALGAISSGEGDDDEIGSEEIARTIREARLDKKIRAIVLRVNSPGGSALASDVIWREVKLARKAKPTIVSMGDVAASGGYYISCAADRIFAEPNTITGSIGVFGLIPNISRMLNSKLGITIDTVNTNSYSDVGSTLRGLRKEESAYVQESVERVYSTFIARVAEGRHLEVAQVDSIGQGRVWSGTEALKIGLIDELGGLQAAIDYAAKKADLDDYKLIELPKQKNPFESFLRDKEDDAATQVLRRKLGNTYNYLDHLRKLAGMKGVQARLPFEFELK